MNAAQELHTRALVADTHNDLLCSVASRKPERWGSYFREQWLPLLRAGGVNLQVLPVFIDDQYRPEGALRRTLRMIEAAHRIAADNADSVRLSLNGEQVDGALQDDRIALVLALEGMPGIDESVELLETMHRLGVRIASMAHFGRGAFADGSAEDAAGSRLTAAGVEAVAEMERVGIMLDISHLGVGGVDHLLEIATRPVIATHSSARALLDHHRNLSDAQLRGIADNGGVVCVNFYAPFLDSGEASIDRLIDHIEHIAGVVGVDRVGLGPDFVREVLEDTTAPCCDWEAPAPFSGEEFLPGLEGPEGLPLVTEALLRRGWAEAEILGVLGGNVASLFRAELGRTARERG